MSDLSNKFPRTMWFLQKREGDPKVLAPAFGKQAFSSADNVPFI